MRFISTQVLCHADDAAVLLTPDVHDSQHGQLEQQLVANSHAGSGALEHDPCRLYSQRQRLAAGEHGKTRYSSSPNTNPLAAAEPAGRSRTR